MRIAELSGVSELHHAYLVTGGADRGKDEVLSMLKKRGILTSGNPDLAVHSFFELLIDDVRDTLLSFASLKPLGDRKYLIVSYSRANDASQNALLKAVEESLGKTTFFFCVDSPGHMLPTLRSRTVQVTVEGVSDKSEESTDAEVFVKAGYEKRLSAVEKMTAYISKTQDRGPARAFVASVMKLMHGKAPAAVLRDVLDADRYLRMQGSSPKSVLSHLAVTLPIGKK